MPPRKGLVKTPTVFQLEATECGAACLSMILSFWGRHLPLEQLRIETGVSRDGCNAGNIIRAAKNHGMDCRGFKKTAESLKKLNFPCIIYWNSNHFVVLDGFKGKYAYINDPAAGRRRVAQEELKRSFSGVVMTFEPNEKFVKEKKKDSLLILLKKRLAEVKSLMVKAAAASLILTAPVVAAPFLFGFFIDNVMGSTHTPSFIQFLMCMTAVMIFQGGLRLYRAFVLNKAEKKLSLLSAREFISRLFRLPVNFYEQRYAADISARVDSNERINSFLGDGLWEIVLNIFSALVCFISMLLVNPVMTLAGVAGSGINLLITRLISSAGAAEAVKLKQDKGLLTGAVCAGLGITSTLKASGAENAYFTRVSALDEAVSAEEKRIDKINAAAKAISETGGMLLNIMLLILGGFFTLDGNMTSGAFFVFMLLFCAFSESVGALSDFVGGINTLRADISRAEDIIKYPEDEKFTAEYDHQPNKKLSGRIECSNITFGYSRLGKPVIENLSFSLNPGGSVAFVGGSGCGKSTVIKLISGLYSQWEGSISLDGISSEKISPALLHASISAVSQNSALFSGTVRDNLTMWNPAVSERDMIQAAKDACIHDFIIQKKGAYDYIIKEGGANLSGGQRQRMEIARALAANPTILIMDEATSALDPITEKQILDNIKRRGCTCIIVAHRLSAVRDCDTIIVMKDGRPVEIGSHNQLVSKQGYYTEFMNSN